MAKNAFMPVGGEQLSALARGPFDKSKSHAISRSLRARPPRAPVSETPKVAGRDQVDLGALK
jgi:hypothetical protein